MTTVGLAIVVIAAAAGWVAWDLMKMQGQLEDARSRVVAAQTALIGGDATAVSVQLETARSDAARALAIADAMPLRLVADIPLLGGQMQVATDLARVGAEATDCLVAPGPRIAQLVGADNIRTAGGGFDVGALRAVSPDISKARECMARVTTRAQVIPKSAIPRLDHARSEIVGSLTRQSELLGKADVIARLAPDMLGVDRDRTYILGLQTNAEARGTGGIIGGFLVVRAHQGRLTVISRVDDLEWPPSRPLSLGQQYDQLYGYAQPTQLWQNSNLSPHFPYAAQIWRNLWKQRSGQSVDGVAAVDPVALGYLLGASGPLTLADGETVNAQSFTELAEEGVYTRFANDRTGRKQFIGNLGAAVFNQVFSTNGGNTVGTVEALAKSVTEGRIALWSANPTVEEQLSTSRIGHTVPYSPAPYTNVIINNSAGSKLDYYLQRSIDRRVDGCRGDARSVTVDVGLTNAVPTQALPSEVLGPPKEAFGPILQGSPLPPKVNRVTVSLYASWGSSIQTVEIDGQPVGFGTGSELGHPVAYAVVTLQPNISTTISFSLSEPALPGPVDIPDQSLVRAADVTSSGLTCSR